MRLPLKRRRHQLSSRKLRRVDLVKVRRRLPQLLLLARTRRPRNRRKLLRPLLLLNTRNRRKR